MVKKSLTLTMGLIVATVLMAQPATKSVTINSSDIDFWVGSGSNSTVVAIGWDAAGAGYTPTVVVWGLHWNGSITLLDALDSVATYDSRFTYTMSGTFLQSLDYNDPATGVHLTPYQYWNCNNYNGVYGSTTLTSTWLRISESTCDNYNFTGVSNLIYASDPNSTETPEDATIEAEDLTYWVGEGPFEIVFAVNWPDTALAWGYRFSARSTNLQNVMNDIAAADPRLTFVTGSYGIDDILFVENGDTLRKAAGSWWEHMLNGNMSAGVYQQLNDGDFSRWADPTAGVVVDSTYDTSWNYWMYTRAYPQTIHPVSAPTPTDATISTSDLIYWVGEGSNELTFVVNWADTALAWGYRFANDSVTLATVMDDIAAADPRFSYSGEGLVNDIYFVEHGDTLSITPGNWWSHLLNGYTSAGMGQWMHHGDFSRWADPAAGVVVDSIYHSDWNWWEYINVYPQTIYPVSNPAPQSATISANDIRYWVGEGDNQLIFVVNWPGTALAWGYHFSETNVDLQTVMNDIAAADSRLQFVEGSYGIDDILFIENGDTLRKADNSWWEHTVNGEMSAGVYQQMNDGDFSRWADPTAGVMVDSIYHEEWGGWWEYIYAYPQSITPVNNPNIPDVGPFCGAVGTEGCTAVKYDDSRIKGWATGCTVVRGSSNLLDPEAAPVNYGTEADAVGPASSSTMDVVSLGDGGMATLTFDIPIANGDGYDFAVFENPFNDSFLELAVVEVSSDGEHFVRFPATSLTQTNYQITDNNGGVDPTFINNLAGKYRVGYGTPFDLEELRDSANIDINNVTHVRVIDVVGSIDPQYGTYDAFGHLINDPFPTITYSSGFDLDGVAVMNSTLGITEVQPQALSIYPNPANHSVVVSFEAKNQRTIATLYDMTGRTVATLPIEAGITTATLNTSALSGGIYMLQMDGKTVKMVVRH